jgi:hypothetical protein
MSRLATLVVGILLGAAGVFGALKYHVLRTDEGLEFVPKQGMSLADTYVDARQFGVSDWLAHGDLARAVIAADKQHLIGRSAVDGVLEGVSGVMGLDD